MKVIIGSPVKTKTRKNTWEVDLTCMSGDADAYHQNGGFFTSEQEMLDYVTISLAIGDAMDDGYARDTKQVEARLEKILSSELFAKYMNEYEIWDMCGSDVTCEGYLAVIDDVEVFWYDENGVKYNCTIED